MSTADDDDDYYAVLGCQRSASQDELRRAYHRLARNLHPDRRPDAAAHAQMASVGEAWAILKNPRLRAVYDRDGREGVDDLSDAASDDNEGSSFPRGWPGAATSGASPSSAEAARRGREEWAAAAAPDAEPAANPEPLETEL